MAKDKLGLVLEGGGVKGAYEAGILDVLCAAGANFDGAAGTSIGAINSALYVEGGVELVTRMWAEVWAGTVMDIDDEILLKIKDKNVDKDVVTYLSKRFVKMRKLLKNSYDKTEKFFSQKVHEDRMRSSGKQLGLVAYCLTDRRPVELLMDEVPEGKLVDFLVASATFPIFPPKDIDGKKYIDGGVYDNMPINLLARGGFEKALVIRTNPADKKPKIHGAIKKGLDLYFIVPDRELAHAMEFTSEKVNCLLQKGREDARLALESGLAEFLGV